MKEERNCENCKHYVLNDSGFWACEKWKCNYEPEEEDNDK